MKFLFAFTTEDDAAAVFFKACVPTILIELSIRVRVDAILTPLSQVSQRSQKGQKRHLSISRKFAF